MDSSGTLVANGLNNNFHLFILIVTSEKCSVYFNSNLREMFCKIGVLQLVQKTLKNLCESSFLVKIKDGLIMNSFTGISFL